ncbi:MAG: MgtC/SapB family protein [Hyphomicrobiales bacterium]
MIVAHQPYIDMCLHVAGALAAGGFIGWERTFHGRSAGFRTHTLVCVASCVLMLVTRYQSLWLPAMDLETFRTDPTRMAQGIMTGIGFLGAGIIYKEGFSVRGLTTAGSIWVTAAIGILYGIGFYFPAILTTITTLGILSIFRWFEKKLPSQQYVHLHIRFERDKIMAENDLRTLIAQHGYSVANMSYSLVRGGRYFEYRMVIRTTGHDGMAGVAESLRADSLVHEFMISPGE